MNTMMKLLKYTALLCLGVIIALACAPESETIKQNWKGTIISSDTDCKNIGKDLLGNYDLVVEFGKVDTFLLTVANSGNVFQGIRSQADSNLFIFTASFREDAGVVSEKMEIRITEPGKGIGSSEWSWTDGLMNCTGTFEFTIEKLTE